MKTVFLPLLAVFLGAGTAFGESKDVPVGYVPIQWIGPTLQRVLSPQGRFLLLTPTGPVRITDTQAKIDAAVDALEKLQHAPALVALNLNFTVFGQKQIEKKVVQGPSGGGDEFPYPTKFTGPKIVQRGNTTVVVPTMPTKFSNSPTGPSQVTTITETVQTKDIVKRLAGSSVPGQPAPLPILSKVEDPAALQALAVKLGAIKDAEPVWTAASTELLVRSELSGGELVVLVTPQIALPASEPGAQPRRIPLKMCAAAIPLKRGAASPNGTLPNTDADFYRLFLGVPAAAPNAVTALSVAADVKYVGAQAK